jgi:hypothetical protein
MKYQARVPVRILIGLLFVAPIVSYYWTGWPKSAQGIVSIVVSSLILLLMLYYSQKDTTTDESIPRLWWVVGAVGMAGLIVLDIIAPTRVFGLPASQFTMLYMATFVFALVLVTLSEDQQIRALGLSIVAAGFLMRVAESIIGEQVSVVIAIACLVIGLAINIFGGALADSRATLSN